MYTLSAVSSLVNKTLSLDFEWCFGSLQFTITITITTLPSVWLQPDWARQLPVGRSVKAPTNRPKVVLHKPHTTSVNVECVWIDNFKYAL